MVVLVYVLIFIEERVRAAVVDANSKVQATHGAASADKERQNRSLPRLIIAPAAEPFQVRPVLELELRLVGAVSFQRRALIGREAGVASLVPKRGRGLFFVNKAL